jgi:hypothetical protein
MARLPQSGSAISSLYERPAAFEEMIFEHLIVLFLVGLASQDEIKKAFDEIVKSFAELGLTTTLSEVISDLGLAPLSPNDEQKVRDELGAIIGRGLQELGRLQIASLQTTLRRVARGLKGVAAGRRLKSQAIRQIEQILHSRETGFHKAHDITAASEIVTALAGIVGDRDTAEAIMNRWTDHPRETAAACHIADERLGTIVGKSGQPAIDWYVEFVSVLKFIAAKNNIKPTISTNPVTLKRQGRFLALATAVEQLLPLCMRSSTDEARAQRLKRSLRRN